MYRMRTLYLLRHAKALAWDDPSAAELADFDRPLTDRGRRDAAALAEHLRLSGCRPKLIACSPALRTRQTLDLVASGLGLQARTEVDERLYAASMQALWQRVHELPDGADEAMLVGHNPGIHELAANLADHGDDKLRARVREKLPTCGFVTIAWAEDRWTDLRKSAGVLHDFVTPRDL
jgi:phosphohistidine phosphatase